MRNVTGHSEIDALRQDLEHLLDRHRPHLRAEELRLRVAMWEYEQSLQALHILQAA